MNTSTKTIAPSRKGRNRSSKIDTSSRPAPSPGEYIGELQRERERAITREVADAAVIADTAKHRAFDAVRRSVAEYILGESSAKPVHVAQCYAAGTREAIAEVRTTVLRIRRLLEGLELRHFLFELQRGAKRTNREVMNAATYALESAGFRQCQVLRIPEPEIEDSAELVARLARDFIVARLEEIEASLPAREPRQVG